MRCPVTAADDALHFEQAKDLGGGDWCPMHCETGKALTI